MISTIALIFTMTLFQMQTYIYKAGESGSGNWYVVDDGVMGGLSQGQIQVSDGILVFSGNVSLDNNGGFSSIRYACSPGTIKSEHSSFILRIKGDGQKYQFRSKSSQRNYESYIYEFETSGEWQSIEVPFNKMYPGFRGRKLNMPNYNGDQLGEIGFLIADKQEGQFELQIESVSLK